MHIQILPTEPAPGRATDEEVNRAASGDGATSAPPADPASDASAASPMLCRVCARMGHTCCQGHDIFITLGDCRRIAAHTGLNAFFEYRGCVDAGYADQADDPVWAQRVFRSDGSRRVLKRQPNDDCLFLAPDGCRLPLDVRPLVCRLYPHTYSARGLDLVWDPECPAARSLPPLMFAGGIAGVALPEAVQWHHLLYDELMLEERVDENRTHL